MWNQRRIQWIKDSKPGRDEEDLKKYLRNWWKSAVHLWKIRNTIIKNKKKTDKRLPENTPGNKIASWTTKKSEKDTTLQENEDRTNHFAQYHRFSYIFELASIPKKR